MVDTEKKAQQEATAEKKAKKASANYLRKLFLIN